MWLKQWKARTAFSSLAAIVLCLPLMLCQSEAQATSATSRECLVILKTGQPDFGKQAEANGIVVIAHSSANANWWLKVNGMECSRLGDVPGVQSVKVPMLAMVSLDAGAAVPEKEAEALGGIVYRRFESISAASIVVPEEKFDALAKLPGVKKVRKDHSVEAAAPETKK
jgi:hypothetical protein